MPAIRKPFKNLPFSEKRNIVLTEKGWTRVVKAGGRTKTEILYTMSPRTSQELLKSAPEIVEVFVSTNEITAKEVLTVNVVFNQNVNVSGDDLTLSLSGTKDKKPTESKATLKGSDGNILSFEIKLPAGEYAVEAQQLAGKSKVISQYDKKLSANIDISSGIINTFAKSIKVS